MKQKHTAKTYDIYCMYRMYKDNANVQPRLLYK